MSETPLRQVALVTGGARGIGRACARALAAAGHDIVLVDLLVPEMERTAAEIRDSGREVMIVEADVASYQRAQEVALSVKARFGRVDFLLNNAGKAMPKGILEIATCSTAPSRSTSRAASTTSAPSRQ